MYYMGLRVNQTSICLKGILRTHLFLSNPGKFNMQLYSPPHFLCVIYLIYVTALCEIKMPPISEGTTVISFLTRGDNTRLF